MRCAAGIALFLGGIVLFTVWPMAGIGLICWGGWLCGTASVIDEEQFMGLIFVLATVGVVIQIGGFLIEKIF